MFDTNILIDYLNGIAESKRAIEEEEDKAVSVITWMEVMVGARASNEAATRSFLMRFVMLPITVAVAERAVVERQQRRLKLPDAIVLATAVVGKRVLVTRNTRDFSVDDPAVRIPYQM